MDGDTNSLASADGANLYHPDEVIHPNDMPVTGPAPSASTPPTAPQAAPASDPSPQPVAPTAAPVPAATQPLVPTAYLPPKTDTELDNAGPITWTASEFIAHQKTAGWYMLLALAAVAVAVVVWLLTRDFFPTIAVLAGVILLGAYAGRQPRQESYTLDMQGLTIGSRHYGFNEFRSFSLVPDGAFLSIELMPLKRFAVSTTIYVDPADEDRIVEHLAGRLPMEAAQTNIADSLMRRIRF